MRPWIRRLWLTGLFVVGLAAVVWSQGGTPTNAQIVNFWRFLMNSPQTVNSVWTFTVPPVGGGGAPSDATYITQIANATLTNEQALAALSTGLLNVATTTGILTSFVPTDDNLLVG